MASRAVPAFPGFLQRLPDRRWVVVGAAFLLGWLLFAVVRLRALCYSLGVDDPQ